MHEIGMFQEALGRALSQAARHSARRVTAVTVQIGAASGVVPDVIEQAFAVLASDTIAAGAALRLDLVPAQCVCPQCGAAFTPADELRACSQCGAFGATLVRGHEFGISALEIESDT
jgi:hydrogenase nickel incorporation protein HypA/HybF